MFNPDSLALKGPYWLSFEAGAVSLGVEPVATPVHDAIEIERAIAGLARDSTVALIVTPDLFLAAHYALIIELAARQRVPTIAAFRTFPRSWRIAFLRQRSRRYIQAGGGLR